jgi:hypothetical protein
LSLIRFQAAPFQNSLSKAGAKIHGAGTDQPFSRAVSIFLDRSMPEAAVRALARAPFKELAAVGDTPGLSRLEYEVMNAHIEVS